MPLHLHPFTRPTAFRCPEQKLFTSLVVAVACSLIVCSSLQAGTTLFVKAVSPPGGDGQTWATAFSYLQDALTAARAPGSGVSEVWVAAGVYKPDRDAIHPTGSADPSATFQLINGVAVRGGFAGNEDPATFNLATRDFQSNAAILNGDLAGNDGLDFAGNGENSYHLVTAGAGMNVTAVLDGFTITGGNGSGFPTGPRGGGVYCTSSSPTIVHNTILRNRAGTGGGPGGGAIYCSAASPTIADNSILANEATYGGGISCDSASSPTVSRNTISGNKAGYGAGVYCIQGSAAIITNNILISNSASSGGGIYCNSSNALIANNTLVANSVSFNGGAIYCASSSAMIVNNTIVGNVAPDDPFNSAAPGGSGIYCSSSAATLANNIVAFNASGILNTGGTPTLRANNVYGNLFYNYSGVTAGSGSISQDPKLLAGAFGEVHLGVGSPCVDKGNDAYVQAGWVDMDGEPRVQGAHVDIGADEFNGAVPPFTPVIIHVTSSGDDLNDGLSWSTAKRTVQTGIDAAAVRGGEVWVAAGIYTERISFRPFVYLYGGFAGDEASRPQRNWTVNTTVLDAAAAGRVVSIFTCGYQLSAIDGFTIRNGAIGTLNAAEDAAGIYCLGSAPTISNNIITGNRATNHGGGLYLSSSPAVVTDNTFIGNSANSGGGGIFAYASNASILRNVITGNTGDNGAGIKSDTCSPTIGFNLITQNGGSNGSTINFAAYGGGISCGSHTVITNNIIIGNNATQGGGIYSFGAYPTIVNNVIAANGSQGIYCYAGDAIITNNTIVSNSPGEAIFFWGSASTVTNNIIAFNSAGIRVVSGAPVLRQNDVYANSSYNYSGLNPGTGDISSDPKLSILTYGDLHLALGSPCIDAGYDAAIQSSWKDLDQEARRQGTHVDIGADEFNGATPPPVWKVVRVSPAGSDANDGSSWQTAKLTVQAGIDSAASSGGEVWVQGGTYVERVALRPFAYLYGGFAGNELDRSQRNWTLQPTTLDGSAAGTVVTALGCGEKTSSIDGFIVRNGNAPFAGGIFCSTGSPTIANNTVLRNVASTGAGIYCYKASPTIRNNTICGNTASGSGGGIYCGSSSPIITNNTITGNTASQGAGVYVDSISLPVVANCTLTANRAGFAIHSFASVTVVNTIIVGNSSGLRTEGTGLITRRFNCVYGNAPNYSGLGDPTGTSGNISVDPQLVRGASFGPDGVWGTIDDDYGDLHLQLGSRCIDAGNNADVPAGTLMDLDGQPRFVDDPCTPDTGAGTPPLVDIGAYEHGVCTAVSIVGWKSLRTHAGLGDLAIPLDPARTGNGSSGPTCEPRAGGPIHLHVEFDSAATLLSPQSVQVQGQTTSNGILQGIVSYTAQVQMIGPTTLDIVLPANAPDQTCYRIDLSGAVPLLQGDTDCMLRALKGDTTSDGQVDMADVILTKAKIGQPAGSFPKFDLTLSGGAVNLTDAIFAASLVTNPPRQALCP